MKFLFDFFPIIVFFVVYQLFDIYVATLSAMIMSAFQLVFYKVKQQKIETIHLVNFSIIFLLGSATLFFHNPWFIKWKPTAIYWLAAIVFFYTAFFSKKPVIQHLMESHISLPKPIWHHLNYAWGTFFSIMGSVNLYVALHYSTDTWVRFKLFGCAGATLLFVLLQAIYLYYRASTNDISPTSSLRKDKMRF